MLKTAVVLPMLSAISATTNAFDVDAETRQRAYEAAWGEKGHLLAFRAEDERHAAGAGTAENASYRMVTTYWDMAASFIAQGILDADLFFESGGEMLVVWAKLEEIVPEIRREMNPRLLVNVEKVIQASASARERVKTIRERSAVVKK